MAGGPLQRGISVPFLDGGVLLHSSRRFLEYGTLFQPLWGIPSLVIHSIMHHLEQ
jgi:hypothetical protein